ncbi:E3 ubiquitin-protein ligase MBR2-like isoform X2 [Castanea sativa]|uniref:E3 ubiquitin-protein ligase MBR2-like isoform X2 n=1 Tax=Castanea sativa TaxID=21020 RepID=UPI003F64C1C3
MNGQGSTSNSFPQTFYVDHGPDVNNLGFLQNNVFATDASLCDRHTVIGHVCQSSSSLNTQYQSSAQELLGRHGWLSSASASDRTGQRFQERHSELNVAPFQEVANIIPNNDQVTNRLSIMQGANSGALPWNVDLNAFNESNNRNVNQDVGEGLSLHLFKPDGLEADQNPHSSNSSIPHSISSGLARHMLEENDGRESLSLEGRRLPCKRRAPQDAHGLMSLGESSSTARGSGNSEWQAVPTQGNANSSLNISTPLIIPPNISQTEHLENRFDIGLTGAFSGVHQTSSGAGQAQGSQRNIRLRRGANIQDFVPPSMVVSGTPRNSHLHSSAQPYMFFPFDQSTNSGSAATSQVNATYPVHPSVHVPSALQHLQPSPWSDLMRLRHGVGSMPPVHAVNGGDTLQQEQNSMNIPWNTLLTPETEGGNVGQNPRYFSIFNRNSDFPRTIANGSRNGTLSVAPFTVAPTRVPEPNMAESSGQGGYYPLNLGTSPALRGMELSTRAGNVRPPQIRLRSELIAARLGRQASSHPENPPLLQSISASQSSSRLVAEVLNALALVRRGVTFRFRELLGLEEQIGNVCTGLSDKAILANLRWQKYEPIALGSPVENESCCICQEEYVHGDGLGKLDCGHDFHHACIKQWLVQKNSCPICKKTALAVRDR